MNRNKTLHIVMSVVHWLYAQLTIVTHEWRDGYTKQRQERRRKFCEKHFADVSCGIIFKDTSIEFESI